MLIPACSMQSHPFPFYMIFGQFNKLTWAVGLQLVFWGILFYRIRIHIRDVRRMDADSNAFDELLPPAARKLRQTLYLGLAGFLIGLAILLVDIYRIYKCPAPTIRIAADRLNFMPYFLPYEFWWAGLSLAIAAMQYLIFDLIFTYQASRGISIQKKTNWYYTFLYVLLHVVVILFLTLLTLGIIGTGGYIVDQFGDWNAGR